MTVELTMSKIQAFILCLLLSIMVLYTPQIVFIIGFWGFLVSLMLMQMGPQAIEQDPLQFFKWTISLSFFLMIVSMASFLIKESKLL